MRWSTCKSWLSYQGSALQLPELSQEHKDEFGIGSYTYGPKDPSRNSLSPRGALVFHRRGRLNPERDQDIPKRKIKHSDCSMNVYEYDAEAVLLDNNGLWLQITTIQ
jgi:hypothetical protein